LKKYEPKHRQIRFKLLDKVTKPGRKSRRELKNKRKHVRGTAKLKVQAGQKKKDKK